MKNQVYQFLFNLLVVLLFCSCTATQATIKSYKAKLVVAYCSFYIIEILEPDDSEQGIEWTDSKGKNYENVFTVANFCDFQQSGIKTGQLFSYRIIPDTSKNNCAVCLGYIETPSLKRSIAVVNK